jgi:aldose 1-epimerase
MNVLQGDVLLQAGAARAVLRPSAGGRICSLELARADGTTTAVLHPYTAAGVDPLRWAKGGIYPLVPYSNRIEGAVLQTARGSVPLPPHPDGAPHTLHGHAHGLPWTVTTQSQDSATLTLDSPPCAAWPWHLQAHMQLQLTPDALTLRLEVQNISLHTMPAGMGWHPYFRHLPTARLRYTASELWPTTADYLAEPPRALTAAEDFSQPRALRDGTMTDYLGGCTGAIDLELPEGDVLSLTQQGLPHLVAHRPAQPVYLCLEPVSHVANGFNLAARGQAGTGTVQLAQGQAMRSELTLTLKSGFE